MEPWEYNSSHYDRKFTEEGDRYFRVFSRKAEIAAGLFPGSGRFLDIGCGDGSITSKIAEMTGMEPSGVDVSGEAVRMAKGRGINAVHSDLGKGLPYGKGSFDAVFCGDTLEHVYGTLELLREIRRVLRPGGCLVLTVPNTGAWYNRFFLLIGWLPAFLESSEVPVGNPFFRESDGHVRAFTKKSLSELLSKAGLRTDIIVGSPMMGDGSYGRIKERVWEAADGLMSRWPSLSSTLVIRAFR